MTVCFIVCLQCLSLNVVADVGIYEIQSIPQLGVICYGGDKTRDESHSVYIGTLESNGLFHYPLYFGMSLFDYLLCCLCCKCSCTRECRIGNNDNSNDSTNNTNVIAPAENINEPDALPGKILPSCINNSTYALTGNEEYLAVINQIEGPALSITRELTSFQKQIKDFEDSCKDANVDNNTIDQQASHLDEIIEKLKAWQTTYPENRELSAILTRAISLLKIIEDGEEGDDELLQADPQFL